VKSVADKKKDDGVIIDKTIENLADEPAGNEPEVQSPVTPAGQPVEEQVRKEWEPNKNGGLPTFLRKRRG
jgi:hypothetical protein